MLRIGHSTAALAGLALLGAGAGSAAASTYYTPEQTLTVAPTTPLAQPAPLSLTTQGPGPTASLTSPAYGNFDIVVNYTSTVTDPAILFAFAAAESFWESQILGYRTSTLASLIPSLTINASIIAIDGVGGILGQAGATSYYDTLEYDTPNAGIMQFDTADVANLVANGSFDEVILHEMAHVMGFSDFFWTRNGAVDPGSPLEYVGTSGLDAYRREFVAGAAFVPLENAGGAGTAFAHWDEETFANHQATFGNNRNPELMTGALSLPTYVSQTTVYSFEDIGYAVLPLPGAGWMLLGGLGLMAAVGRRRMRIGQRSAVDSGPGAG